jgi:hypothetical protein
MRVILAALGMAAALNQLRAQTVVRLDKPVASHPAEWTNVIAVRELSSGKVLVLDAREQVVKLVDFAAGSASMVGAKGNGPGEYIMPTGLYALPADSTLVYDEANSGRPVLIGSLGTPLGTLSSMSGDRPVPFIGAFNEFDALGRVYAAGPMSNAEGVSAIERWTRKTGRMDTVGFFSRRSEECAEGVQAAGPPALESRARFARASSSAPTPFPAIEEWAVSADGRVAVVCAKPYHVKIRDADGRLRTGAPITYDRIRVTDAEKEAWREERGEPVAVIRMAAGGKRTASYERRPVAEPSEWPDYLPPFRMHRSLRRTVIFAPNGMLWVERAVAGGAPALYDVIGLDAKLAYRVTMPPRTRLVGFGASGVYAVHTDDDDLQRLQRFRFPPVNGR